MKARLHKTSGAALPLTLLLVVFNVTVLVALLVYATTELNASRNALGSSSSRIMALSGVDLASALIAANSTNNAFVTYQNIVTNVSGDTNARLETKIANVVPIPGAVDPSFQRQVTNPTALHSGFAASSDDRVDLNYATKSDTNSGYILPRSNPVGSNWRNLHTNMFQMKWVNIYKGPSSDPTNLIGRFAFWVDDESTKLNINYSGTTDNYDTNSYNNSGPIRTSLFGPRGTKGTNVGLGQEFDGFRWPLYMELGGVAGLSRTNAYQIINRRGNPIWRSDDSSATIFAPYYSLMESRLGTLPPVPGGLAVTNISLQSQLAFTATIYTREPEISYATGSPRFDLFNFTREWSGNAAKVTEATNGFLSALNGNYPGFSQKYSLPQYVAAIRSAMTAFGSGAAVVQNFPYTPSGGETKDYNNRALPLVNETQVILKSSSDGTNQSTSLEATVELVFLSKSNDFPPDYNSSYYNFDELHMQKSRFESGYTNYSANLTFSPPLQFGTNTISSLPLTPVLTNWFACASANASSQTNTLKPFDTQLTGLFALLKATNTFSTTNNPNELSFSLPTTVRATISYQGSAYQSVNATQSLSGNQTNSVPTSGGPYIAFWWTSQPQGTNGVRGDPRLGLHQASITTAPAWDNTLNSMAPLLPGNLTNTNASIGRLNPTWQPGAFETTPLSPDITPPYTVFAADRGINYNYGNFFLSSGDLGEIPITTYKSGTHLAWSTPRFWGDGRTNLSDGQVYPPDWLMLDCVHTAMFPPNTNRPFATYATNFVSYGRFNINGLKTYFQTPKGSTDRSDTLMDSLLIQTRTKDIRDYDTSNPNINEGMNYKQILPGYTNRVNLLNYMNQQALTRGQSDTPFLTGYDFTAFMAGNTNVTNVSPWWESFTPGATNTSDTRIESFVRSLQQRVTSHGFQFCVYSLGQSLQVVKSGSGYKTNIVGEAYMQAVLERAPKHNLDGTISNGSPGGAPPMRLLYLRELR